MYEWRVNDPLRTPLEQLTPAQMRVRTREYWLMSVTAPTTQARTGLLLMAEAIEGRATENDGMTGGP